MERNDAQLIRSILSGDDAAFSTLVQRYQKSVHALAWRKIGDFHYAEEITQDTFLRAYKKLYTLKNPNQFAGWLYVIANRLCVNWARKQKPTMQSTDGTLTDMVEQCSYARYVSEQRETEASEHQSEIVQKLLARLPESERTVMTLYYLGEMPAQEISKFLGVSVRTIHSRLHRARKRLQEKEELLIHEVLGGIKLPVSLTESIMAQVADLKPTPSPIGKPLFPWAVLGTTAVMVIMLLGASNQYLVRYQKPYSFEARSERTIEIVDTLIVLDVAAKPAVRNQIGRADSLNKNSGAGLQPDEKTLASNRQKDSPNFSNSQWAQTNGPYGGDVHDIFVTSERTLYATAPTGIYRLTDAPTWKRINTDIPLGKYRTPMAEYGDNLYIVSAEKIYVSADNGETWDIFCSRPNGHPTGLSVIDAPQSHNSDPHPVMYLALQGKGVFRSTDAGEHWNHLRDGLSNENVYAVAVIGDTVFAGTNKGLYRFNSDLWQQVSIMDLSGSVHFITGFENDLYIGIGSDLFRWRKPESEENEAYQMIISGDLTSSRTFHSTDLGASWTEITHVNESPFMNAGFGVVLLTNTGESLLPQGVVAVDNNTFYRAGPFGIHRSTDGGKSWFPFMNGIMGTTVQDLVASNNRLYAYTGKDLVQSVNGGETWETVLIDAIYRKPGARKKDVLLINTHFVSRLVMADDVLYGITSGGDGQRVFQLFADDEGFVPVHGAPAFEQELESIELLTETGKPKIERYPNNLEKNDNLSAMLQFNNSGTGEFAVSNQKLYVEYERRLFRWKPGDSEWTDTGLIDTSESHGSGSGWGFKLAVSGETLYVGKRDGELFQSLDDGNSWKDVTPNLPLDFKHFEEIVFAGSTVYVATDTGVLTSQTGEHWSVVPDKMGGRPVIDKLAVDGLSVYGAGDGSVYRLDGSGKWKQISRSVPDKVVSLAISNNRLYIATQSRGLFHIPIGKSKRG